MKNNHVALFIILAVMLVYGTGDTFSWAGSASKDTGSGSTNTSPGQTKKVGDDPVGSDVYNFVQDPFDATNGLDIRFDGTPSQIDGRDYNLDGSLIAGENAKNVAAIGVVDRPNGEVDGTNETAQIGVTLTSNGNGDSVIGGIRNDVSDKVIGLEKLIEGIKNAHDTVINISGGNTTLTDNPGQYGAPGDYKVVYARGQKNANGSTSEGKLTLSGDFKGYGILLIEADNPDNVELHFTGQAEWTGLVLFVGTKQYHASNTGNSNTLWLTGGGNTGQHILGGAMIYFRNVANGANTSLFDGYLCSVRGNSSIHYSGAALSQALAKVKLPYLVKSWRKIR
jgi:hypothetical protein